MDKRKKITEIFHETARPILARHPELSHQWIRDEKRPRYELVIRKQNEQGFDVGLICEPYGLYPWAGQWRGSLWDAITPDTSLHHQQVCENCLGFLRTLLSPDSRLRILSKAGKPYRWILELTDGQTWKAQEETGLFFYPYFAKAAEMILQNHHLPSRRETSRSRDGFWHASWLD